MININQRVISLSNEPYIIAELSANHNGSLERAKLSIKSAKESGAHAVKFQTWRTEDIILPGTKSLKYQKNYPKINLMNG